MSTILKALKKVEGKRAASAVKFDMPEIPVVPRVKEGSNGLKWLLATGLLLLVVLSAVAGYQFWQTDKPTTIAQKVDAPVDRADKKAVQSPALKTSLPQETLPDKPVVESASTAPELPIKKPEVVEETSVPKPLPKKSSAQSLPATQDLPAKKAVIETSPRQQVGKKPLDKKRPPNQLRAKSEPKKTSPPKSRPKAIVQPVASPQAEPTVERKPKKPDVPLLEDRSLEIQALVYSEDAAKRMIVLNGEILRQGHAYKGYTIEAIESKRVLVRKNGKVSALPFGK